MKKILIILYRYISQFGLDPILTFKWFKNIFFYIQDYLKINKDKLFPISLNYPCLHDKYDNWWTAKWHYFHQDLLVAQKIFQNNPQRHIDVGSRVDGFVAHIASFRNIEVFDIRNLENKVENINFKQLDLMQTIPTEYIEYTDSLSCLHTIEHFWLGRYGDQIDIDWHKKWFAQMTKILKSGWKFYFSTPIGEKQRIEFNAHRVFSLSYLLKIIKSDFEVLSFSYVDDKGDLHQDINLTKDTIQNTFNLNYGCGIFELKKK